MKLRYDQIYRGYQWKITALSVYAVCWRNGRIRSSFKLGDFIIHASPDHSALAQIVHEDRKALALAAPERRFTAFDHVPWEIHEIPDETAYESALAAYKANA